MTPDIIEEDITRLIISLIAGSVIGAEREYNNKNAGFRTVILVTVGATLFTLLSGLLTGGKDFHVAGNVVVGIGFLGAGTIFKEGSSVKGITTAATIWVSAAIGMAIGIGEFAIAFMSLFIVMLVLLGFIWLQSFIDRFNREKVYKITVPCLKLTLDEINEFLKECGLTGFCVNRHKIKDDITLTIIVKGPEKKHEKLISMLQNNEHVLEFEV
jgi:putative Mg2+ transporter-C (MgtC) family protein